LHSLKSKINNLIVFYFSRLGAAGIIAQELVNGKEIFVNLGLAEDRFDASLLPVQSFPL
jgi:hypothetical protein